MSLDSDASMGDGYTDSQLEREASALLAADPTNDRIEDGLATGSNNSIQANAQRLQDNISSNTGDNKVEEASSEEVTGNLDSLMAAGGALISRFASQSQQSMASGSRSCDSPRTL